MAVTDAQFQMLLELVKETRDDVKAIREDYARGSDLQACRVHCDVVTPEVFGRLGDLEKHRACLNGAERARKEEHEQAEKERKELQGKQDLEVQRGQRTYILAGSILTAMVTLIAMIGSVIINKLWP